MHAPGIDAEEETREGDEAEKRSSGCEEMTLTEADDGGGGEAWREKRGDGLDVVEDAAEQRQMTGGVMMTSAQSGIEVEIEVLEAERAEEDECGEDFAGASR